MTASDSGILVRIDVARPRPRPSETLTDRHLQESGLLTWTEQVLTALPVLRSGRTVKVIFIHSEAWLSKSALLAGFLNRAAARGVNVEWLFGAPESALTANHAVPPKLLQRANAFAAGRAHRAAQHV